MRHGLSFGVLMTAAVLAVTLGVQPGSAHAEQSATPTPSAAASATPAATPSPAATTASGLSADPSLAEMNASGNHTMGSTISTFDPNSSDVTMNQQARTLMAPLTASVPPGVPGLDVSSYQTTTAATWRNVYADGGRFVYVKATESTNYASDAFYEQYSDSYKAGLIHGAYHFAHPNSTSGATQANFFVNNGGGWSNDGRTLPPLLDIEYNPSGATCYGLSQSAMVSWIADFSKTVQSRTGRLPAIYTTTDWWTRCTGNTGKFSANPLLIARYPIRVSDGPGTLPNGWSKYTMWQWADAGTFPGDQDVFNGTLTQLQAFARGSVAVDPPPVNPMRVPIFGVGDLNGDGKPDFLARRPDGTLWFYAGTGAVSGSDQGYRPAVKIGTGWNMFDEVLGVGDFNGDGKPDLIARKPDGTLWFYASAGTTAAGVPILGAAVQIGRSGWNAYQEVTASGDFNGDRKPDLIARKSDGTLWFYAGTGVVSASSEGYRAAVQIGVSGWNSYLQVLGIGDLNRDGHSDLVAMRTDGSLWFYAGTGSVSGGDDGYRPPQRIAAPGLAASDVVAAVGDLNSDHYPDLLARATDGTLKFIGGTSIVQQGYLPSVRIGRAGWDTFSTVVGPGDFNGDGKSDLVGVRTDGSLWFYAGTGTASGTSEGYLRAVRIGRAGWTTYTTLVGPGDFNGDGKPDLIGVRADGTLWFYAGTGTASAVSEGYQRAVRIGNGGWNAYTTVIAAGDLNGDRKPDLLAVGSDGALWFYAGTGAVNASNSGYLPRVKVGTGWGGYRSIVGPGDLNGDGKPDLIASRSDGSLQFFAGTGTTGTAGSGFAASVQIGRAGWTVYTRIVATGDFNGDARADFVGTRADGSLWFYAGTGTAGERNPGFDAGVVVGSGWSIFG